MSDIMSLSLFELMQGMIIQYYQELFYIQYIYMYLCSLG